MVASERVEEALYDRVSDLSCLYSRSECSELVPADAHDHIAASERILHGIRYGYKDLVADIVSVCVVDGLEFVRVDHHEHAADVLSEQGGHLVLAADAVQKAGHAVSLGQAQQFFAAAFLGVDGLDEPHHSAEAAVLIALGSYESGAEPASAYADEFLCDGHFVPESLVKRRKVGELQDDVL